MGTPTSTVISAGDDVLASQYNVVRADAISPTSWSTPSAIADFLSLTQAVDLLDGTGEFERWPAGAAKTPARWKLSTTTGFAASRSNDAESGAYALKLTNSSGSGQYAYGRASSVRFLRGRYVSGITRAKVGGGVWQAELADSTQVLATSATFNGASYVDVLLAASVPVANTATYVELRLKHSSGAGNATFDAAKLYLGRIPLSGGVESVIKPLTSGVFRSSIIDSAFTAGAAKAAKVYSPSKEDTIGNWEDRCVYTSWYNDDTNGASSGLRDFPDPAIIVAGTTAVKIYDNKGDLWMAFTRSGSGTENAIGSSSCVVQDIAALNGKIYVATTEGLRIIDFIRDEVLIIKTTRGYRFKGTIAQRDTAAGIAEAFDLPTNNMGSNDVRSVDVRQIGQHTTIAIGTANGTSVVKWESGTHVLIRQASSEVVESLKLAPDGTLYQYINPASGADHIRVNDGVQALLSSAVGANSTAAARLYYRNAYSSAGPVAATWIGTDSANNRIFGVSEVSPLEHVFGVATDAGVSIFHDIADVVPEAELYATAYPNKSAVRYYTKDYSTGHIYGRAGVYYDLGNLAERARGLTLVHTNSPSNVTGVRGTGVEYNGSTQFTQEGAEVSVAHGTSAINFCDAAARTRISQGFQVTRDVRLLHMVVKLAKTAGTPADNVLMEITANNAGVPGTVLATSYEITAANVSTTPGLVRFTFPSGGLYLTASTQYHFVLRRDDNGTNGTNYYIAYDAGAVYASGGYASYNPTTWTVDAAKDIGFDLYTFDTAMILGGVAAELSVGAWIKFDSITGTQHIVDRWSASATYPTNYKYSYLLQWEGGSNFRFAVSSTGEASSIYRRMDMTPSTGEWMFVVGTYKYRSATAGLDLYVNGMLANDDAVYPIAGLTTSINLNAGGPLRIGAGRTGINNDGANFFNGTIAEPFVTPVALTSQQVQEMYEIGRAAIAARGQSYSCVLGGGTNIVRSGALNGHYLLAGSSDGSDAGGLSIIDLKADTRVRFLETPGTATDAEADKHGTQWIGTDADDVSVVAADHGVMAAVSHSQIWIDELTSRYRKQPRLKAGLEQLFPGGGLTSTPSGDIPDSPDRVYFQAGTTVATLATIGGVAGRMTITFPKPFPNGVLSFVGVNGDAANFSNWVTPANQSGGITKAAVVIQVSDFDGTVAGNGSSFRVNWIVVGW